MSNEMIEKPDNCDCANAVNDRLKFSNAIISTNMLRTGIRACIVIEKLDLTKRGKRRRLPVLQATYCPFCGTKYPKD